MQPECSGTAASFVHVWAAAISGLAACPSSALPGQPAGARPFDVAQGKQPDPCPRPGHWPSIHRAEAAYITRRGPPRDLAVHGRRVEPSMDTFDPKPALTKYAGEPIDGKVRVMS
jgi:hypothetical protein